MLDPRHLRVLLEVVRSGSYAGAARALGYTQPAIGQQIATLERHLRTPVLYRSGRNVHLTEAGEILVHHAHGILGAIRSAEDEIESLVGVRRGSAQVALTAADLRLLAAKLLSALRETQPGLRITVRQLHARLALEALRDGDSEIAVVFTLPNAESWESLGSVASGHLDDTDLDGLVVVPLFQEPVVALLPVGHRLADRERVRVADMARERLIGGGLVARGRGADPAQVRVTSSDLLALRDLIAEGHGVAAIGGFAASEIVTAGLVARPFEPRLIRKHVALTLPGLTNVQAVRLTLEAIQTVAARVAGVSFSGLESAIQTK
jgi:DNA-binding transcriptional LysR family regulator